MAKAFHINPVVLKWAREHAKFTEEEAAHKANVSLEKLVSWEKGDDLPTMNQLTSLSKAYKRSLGIFWLPEPPRDFTTLPDFRQIETHGEYSRGLVFIIRQLQENQEIAKELLIEQGGKPLPFVGRGKSMSSPKEVGEDIVNTLAIDLDKRGKVKEWREKAEDAGIFISVASNIHSKLKIPLQEARGFALSDEIAPFIFINTDDSKTAQLFTLVHEIAHIWMDAAGISGELNTNDWRDVDPIERFCNSVAAEVLMPLALLKEAIPEAPSFEDIKKASKVLEVSPAALSFRLYNLKILNTRAYQSIKQDLKRYYEMLDKVEEQRRDKMKEAPGGPNGNLLIVNRNSKSFSSLIYEQYATGRMDMLNASQILGMKLKGFDNILKFI